jgi:opacity protein-like surface antigen
MKLTTGLLAAAIAFAAAPAFAADSGFYAGVGMGYSKISINEGKLNNNIDSIASEYGWTLDKGSVDQNATPYQFTFGYKFMPYLAAEVAWIDMGSADYRGYVSKVGGTGSGSVKGTWEASGWPVSALGIWPINETWSVFGRVGVFMGDVKFSGKGLDSSGNTICVGSDCFKGSADDSSTEFFGGAGVDANFMENWAARFEWQAMPSLGNDDTGSGNFNNFMFSILYKF